MSFDLDGSSFVDEPRTDDCEIINLTTDTSSPVVTLSLSSIGDSPSTFTNEYTCERICRLLKKDPTNYKVIKNVKNNLTSICWKMFGFPAKKGLAQEEFEPIPGFVSCESCFQMYTFTSTFGTRILNSHICVQKLCSATRQRYSSETATKLL